MGTTPAGQYFMLELKQTSETRFQVKVEIIQPPPSPVTKHSKSCGPKRAVAQKLLPKAHEDENDENL